MAVQFDMRIDRDRSGPLRHIEAWNSDVPFPAVVVVIGAAEGRDVSLTIEVATDGMLHTTAVEVAGTRARSVTSASLRSFRLPQLVRAAETMLRIYDEIDAITTVRLASMEDVYAQMRDMQEKWAPDDYAPPLVSGFDGLRADPAWVNELRRLGPRHVRTQRSVAAMYLGAARQDQAPNAYIEKLTGMNSATVSRWVRAAREAGYLPKRSD
ncbi:MAG: hypothetical protein KJ659_00965 [Actinobacteria bacterium]|nr:hypothetical protein [Actinomycetota bacterium]MBU1608930.1 hypothetical protein [Actinomycetota bacterium]MBU2316371.1 hypothetical protein [Actinomycetota bacterium]MBU2384061.1 hypothetical protein [Actinomycetota bacterium]